nr:MAG TPA: hypothetical protein [Caudoviricetes sp.]
MNEIKIRFKSGDVGYFKLEDDRIEDFFDFLREAIRDGLNGVLELIDLVDDKRTIINVKDITSFGYSKVEE